LHFWKISAAFVPPAPELRFKTVSILALCVSKTKLGLRPLYSRIFFVFAVPGIFY